MCTPTVYPILWGSRFNVLCYGFGSKKKLIMDFVAAKLKDKAVVVVNGYFPSLSVKEILKSIIEDSLGYV